MDSSTLNVSRLDASRRDEALERMANERFDLLVVGGGVTGVGTALDGAARGLSVALLEARDLASGTSSKSTKLIHGGLRYLEMLEFGLVKEALRERALLLQRLAPHLVKPVPFVFPLTRRGWERPYVGAGLFLYDRLGGASAVPRARHLTQRGALRAAPALRPSGLVGGVQFWDAQEDDARYVVFLARTAAAHGAQIATRTTVTGFIREHGRVAGVTATDLESDQSLTVRARHVVTAAGVWSDDLRSLVDGESGMSVLRPSKGVHVLVPRDRLSLDTGVFARTEKSVLSIIPWGRHWLIGDTDTDWELDRSHPTATGADVDYLLEKTNAVLADPLGRDDVDGVYAGLRPLVARSADTATTKLSREHQLSTPLPGLTMISGGKYTTYRIMARDLVDAAVADLGGAGPRSVTARVPLLGADGYQERWKGRRQIAARSKLSVEQVEWLLDRYGTCVDDLLALIQTNPALAKPLVGTDRYLAVEVVYACTHEGALHLDDVLSRRTRVAIQVPDRGLPAAEAAAALMAETLNWDSNRTGRELENYRALALAELAALRETEDPAALDAYLAKLTPHAIR